MSLREEIAALMCERYCGIGVMALPEYLPADVEIAEELVNKVLDAAVESVPDGMNGGNYEEDDYEAGWNHALNRFENAINKLRPKS